MIQIRFHKAIRNAPVSSKRESAKTSCPRMLLVLLKSYLKGKKNKTTK